MVKSNVKTAREALDNKEFNTALYQCDTGLEQDPTTNDRYLLLVLRGVALGNLDRFKEAIDSYQQATCLFPENLLAWQGLVQMLEKHHSSINDSVDPTSLLIKALEHMLTIYYKQNDPEKHFKIFAKLINMVADRRKVELLQWEWKEEGQKFYSNLAERRSVLTILSDLIKTNEKIEKDWITAELEKRRFRLGAEPFPLLKEKVELEATELTELEKWYTRFLELDKDSSSTESLRIANCLIKRTYARIPVIKDTKDKKRALDTLITDLCINFCTKIPIAGDYILEFSDVKSVNEYIEILNSYGGKSSYGDLLISDDSETADKYNESKDSLVSLRVRLERATQDKEIINLVKQLEFLIKKRQKEYGIEFPNLSQSIKRIHGLFLVKIKFYEEARMILEELASTNSAISNDVQIIYALIEVYSSNGNHLKAIELMKKVYNLADPNQLVLIADQFYLLKDYIQSKRHYNDALAIAPNNSRALFGLGKVIWHENDSPEKRDEQASCLKLFLESVREDSNIAGAFYYLGLFYARLDKDLIRSEKCFSRALQLDANLLEAAIELTRIWISSVGSDSKQGANEDQFTKLSKQRATAEKIISILEPFGKGHLRSSILWKFLGIAYSWLGENQRAITAFQTSLKGERVEEKQVLELLAEAYLTDKKYTAALKAFKRSVILDPLAIHAKVGVATVSGIIGEYKESTEIFEDLLNSVSGEVQLGLRLQYAKVCLDYGRDLCCREARYFDGRQVFVKGILLLSEIFQIDEHDKDLDRLKSLLGFKLLGDLCFSLYRVGIGEEQDDMLNLLIRLIATCTKLEGCTFELIHNIHKTLEEIQCLKILELAALVYSICVEKSYSSMLLGKNMIQAESWVSLGTILYQLGQYALASDCAKQALCIEPTNSEAWNLFGLVQLSLNQYGLSQHAFIRAIQNDASGTTQPVTVMKSLGIDGFGGKPFSNSASICWLNLAVLYRQIGDLSLVSKCLESVLSTNTEYSLGWYAQAVLEEDSEKKLQLLKQATACEDATLFGHVNLYCCQEYWKRHYLSTDRQVEGESETMMMKGCLERIVGINGQDHLIGGNFLACLLERLGLLQEAMLLISELTIKSEAANDPIKEALKANQIRILAFMGQSITKSPSANMARKNVTTVTLDDVIDMLSTNNQEQMEKALLGQKEPLNNMRIEIFCFLAVELSRRLLEEEGERREANENSEKLLQLYLKMKPELEQYKYTLLARYVLSTAYNEDVAKMVEDFHVTLTKAGSQLAKVMDATGLLSFSLVHIYNQAQVNEASIEMCFRPAIWYQQVLQVRPNERGTWEDLFHMLNTMIQVYKPMNFESSIVFGEYVRDMMNRWLELTICMIPIASGRPSTEVLDEYFDRIKDLV